MGRRGVRVDGDRIRRLREAKAYTRPELAELVGVDPHTLYRIETSKMNTSLPTLRRLSLALGVAPNDLRGDLALQTAARG